MGSRFENTCSHRCGQWAWNTPKSKDHQETVQDDDHGLPKHEI